MALIGRDPDTSAVFFYNLLCHIESQSNTGILTAGPVVDAVETFKDMIEVFRVDANALVNDAHLVIIFVFFQLYRHQAPLWRILYRIIQHIADNNAWMGS